MSVFLDIWGLATVYVSRLYYIKLSSLSMPCSFKVFTCPVRPALVVVKLTSVMTEAASGGISGLGLRVVRKRRNSVL